MQLFDYIKVIELQQSHQLTAYTLDNQSINPAKHEIHSFQSIHI